MDLCGLQLWQKDGKRIAKLWRRVLQFHHETAGCGNFRGSRLEVPLTARC